MVRRFSLVIVLFLLALGSQAEAQAPALRALVAPDAIGVGRLDLVRVRANPALASLESTIAQARDPEVAAFLRDALARATDVVFAVHAAPAGRDPWGVLLARGNFGPNDLAALARATRATRASHRGVLVVEREGRGATVLGGHTLVLGHAQLVRAVIEHAEGGTGPADAELVRLLDTSNLFGLLGGFALVLPESVRARMLEDVQGTPVSDARSVVATLDGTGDLQLAAALDVGAPRDAADVVRLVTAQLSNLQQQDTVRALGFANVLRRIRVRARAAIVELGLSLREPELRVLLPGLVSLAANPS